MSESVTPVAGMPSSILNEGATPSLVTPGQLLQSGPVSSSQPPQMAQRDVQVVQVSSSELSPSIVATEAREPILPLPLPSDHKVFVSQFMVEIFHHCFN
jgi:protein LSM14